MTGIVELSVGVYVPGDGMVSPVPFTAIVRRAGVRLLADWFVIVEYEPEFKINPPVEIIDAAETNTTIIMIIFSTLEVTYLGEGEVSKPIKALID